jgi:hypothetical protein
VTPPGDFMFRSGGPTLGFVFLFLILAPGLAAGYFEDRVECSALTDTGVVALRLLDVSSFA